MFPAQRQPPSATGPDTSVMPTGSTVSASTVSAHAQMLPAQMQLASLTGPETSVRAPLPGGKRGLLVGANPQVFRSGETESTHPQRAR